MAVNRYTRLTPTTYNPRTLQELMIAPSYMRKQHDLADEAIGAYETEIAKVDPLSVHSDLAMEEQKRLYDELSGYADELATSGFSNYNKSNLIRFNKKYQSAISPTGTLGKINAAKQQFNQEKANYINSAIKLGYSPEAAGANWEKHAAAYEQGFDGTSITNINSLYAPEYVNAVEEAHKLFKSAGLTSTDIAQLTESKLITNDPNIPGSYILTTKGKREMSGNNRKQLEAALDYINNQILNPNSTTYKSIIHQGKDPNNIINEVAGLEKVYRKSEYKFDPGAKTISNYMPPKVNKSDEALLPSSFITDKVQGYNHNELDHSSSLIGMPDADNLEFDLETGNLTSGNSKFKTYEDKVNSFRTKTDIVGNPLKIRYNPKTKLYEQEAILHPTASSKLEDSKKWHAISKEAHHYKADLDELRKQNPYFEGLSDQEAIKKLNSFQKSLANNFVESVDYLGSNYEWLDDRIFGSSKGSGENSAGTFMRNGAVLNGTKGTSKEIVEALGYDNDADFKEEGRPSITGYSPTLGKYVATAYDSKGVAQNIYIDAPEQLTKRSKLTRLISSELLKGKDFSNLGKSTSNPEYNMYMINNYTGNPHIIYSKTNAKNSSDLIQKVTVEKNGQLVESIAAKNKDDKVYDYNTVAGSEKMQLLNTPFYKRLVQLQKNK